MTRVRYFQVFRATVYRWDTRARRRTTVAGARSFNQALAMSLMSVSVIEARRRLASLVSSQRAAIETSVAVPFFRGDISARYRARESERVGVRFWGLCFQRLIIKSRQIPQFVITFLLL
ncbi:hypothetical protein ABW40_29035 [Achromobacter xylosoxidans]|nr:hypothetical protein ABW40_29035 [Achromobacter xylosoxidans]